MRRRQGGPATRREAGQRPTVICGAPRRQMRRVKAFRAKQRADLAGLRARRHGAADLALVRRCELAPRAGRDTLTSGLITS